MKKRTLIITISILAILLVAGGVVGALYWWNKPDQATPNSTAYDPTKPSSLSNDPTKQESQTQADLSQDLGACSTVTSAQIRQALGDTAAKVQDGSDRGIAYISGGDHQQSCVYSLTPGETGEHRLTITITSYADAGNRSEALKAFADADLTTVDGLGDNAYFLAFDNDSTNAADPTVRRHHYVLDVFIDGKLVEYSLVIPTESDPLTAESAQAAVVSLAKA